ncbi:hypothetical protein MNBD_ALPHA03-239 [hydrothermal vent metagenome]|uniref:Ribosomal protein S1 n=1 Tax=hydrothermal vent metagenome TaxID=652676 RepID=A0A3B1B9P4_9ZZZZ
MKITIDIDCSPKEVRDFLGLPDIKPLQEAFMANMQDKLSAGLSKKDMDKMFDLWMSPGLKQAGENMSQNMEAFQNIFWNMSKGNDK